MRRYQLFGHLFAASGDDVFRIDRHPVMMRHPVTPISESDVAKHIALQSERLNTAVWSIEGMGADRLALPSRSPNEISVFTIDCMDGSHELAAGKLLWEQRAQNRFVVGSQGVEFALVSHWIKTGTLQKQSPPAGAGRSDGMITVSGSVSPTTAEQINWSRSNGFTTIRFDVTGVCADESVLQHEITRVVERSIEALNENCDPLIFTAEGPDDQAVADLKKAVKASGRAMCEVNSAIGIALGQVLIRVLERSGARRAVVSGGDTSGYVLQQLGVIALSALAPTIPGASLSLVHADGPLDGLEIALKGGRWVVRITSDGFAMEVVRDEHLYLLLRSKPMNRLVATYEIETPVDLEYAATVIAGEQSTGTFIKLEAETDEVRKRSAAVVESIVSTGQLFSPSLPCRKEGQIYERGVIVNKLANTEHRLCVT